MKTIVWIVPEKEGGIQTYSEGLAPAIQALSDDSLKILPPIFCKSRQLKGVMRVLKRNPADLIHIQHEYGLFGGTKLPPIYSFPRWVQRLKEEFPSTKLVATGHNILQSDYQFPYKGHSWQFPIRWAFNRFALKRLRRVWMEDTWGGLDSVIVHSELQVKSVEESNCHNVKVIPHFVLTPKKLDGGKPLHLWELVPKGMPVIFLFGYISPDKGQDVAISALSKMTTPAYLILGGRARRRVDVFYLKYCESMAERLGVSDRVAITGFLPDKRINEYYQKAAIAIAPFRETSGSGSLTHALARGAAVLASDHPINIEVNERNPGTLALFAGGNSEDCAKKLDQLLNDENNRTRLSDGALEYSKANSPNNIAKQHVEFYKELLGV